MTREETVLNYLRGHQIPFQCYHHPEGKTIEEAKRWWHDDGSVHCKNLFFRNHKGNKHYLVCFHCDHDLDIHDLEHRLKQSLVAQGLPSCGKLSFASPERMQRYLGLEPGSVSPFGLRQPRPSLPRQPPAAGLIPFLPSQRLQRHGSDQPARFPALSGMRGKYV